MIASSLRKMSLARTSLNARARIGNINHSAAVLGNRQMSSVITLSDFEATEKFTQLNHKSVLYFTATWCPPCKAIKPLYEELSSKYSNVAFGKVDVDDNSDAALEFNITSVPTFVFFDGEDILERFSGADPKKLESLLQDLDGR
jgi:thioredoxin 1